MSLHILNKLFVILCLSGLLALKPNVPEWKIEKHLQYTLRYTAFDEPDKQQYLNLINTGVKKVNTFFLRQLSKTL
ncbi:hypothetical protein [Mucilaginibacter celer]|uniref:Uncharacterized protein n=1 Tax=Mucilaginibacter celer TaxID=2305508 RepID=A0A494VPP0_9SPHI|nr:hypothetical protein [Mucilaginibacter celer]AYL96734.1 hypothetical protein HYN43_016130 [Mucilaginibacter celer]